MAREISRQTFLRGAAGALAAGTVFGSARAVAEPLATGWEGLSAAIGGHVLLPGSGEFATAKQVFNTNYNGSTPAAIVTPTSVADVQKAMTFAAPTSSMSLRAVAGTPTSGRPRRTAPWCSTCASCRADIDYDAASGQVTVTPRPVCGNCTRRWPPQVEVSRRAPARQSVPQDTPWAAGWAPSPGMRACFAMR